MIHLYNNYNYFGNNLAILNMYVAIIFTDLYMAWVL